jgi:hypothetical protein
MFLRTHRKIYEFNFGLKGLIIMRENAELVMANDTKFLLYCGLVSRQPTITFQEIDEIIEECDLSQIDISPIFLSLYEVEELYTKAVGEVGIAPNDFYSMTPGEIDLAYEGYLRRKETEANLTKIAIISQESEELIRLTEDRLYEIGNKAERQATFKLLLGGEQ